MTPVARRVLGENHRLTLKMRSGHYAQALYKDAGATLDDLREGRDDASRRLNEPRGACSVARTRSQRGLRGTLRKARAALRARETPPGERRHAGHTHREVA